MTKNILLFGDKKYEDLSINLIESFERLPDTYTFYYYTIGFDSHYNNPNVNKIKIDKIEGLPNPQLYKPLTFQHALTLIDEFIYFDSDMIPSNHLDYEYILSSVNKYPKGVYINGWDDPHWWYYTDEGVYKAFNYEHLMDYMKIKNKTQKWASSCVVAINKSCKNFVDEWVDICMNRELWCIGEPSIYKGSGFSIQAWQKYFIVGEETPYNLMLWRDNLKNYYYENIVIEPSTIEAIYKTETSEVVDTLFEDGKLNTYCKNSNLLLGYHQLKNLEFRKKLLSLLPKSNKKSKSSNLKFGLYTSFYKAERFIDYIFNEVAKIDYDNWEWIITDDFSGDNTKSLLLEKVKNFKNIKYVEQSHKKEMYWQPNKFFDSSFDYVVLIDCDDGFDHNFLKVYNKFATKYPDAAVITSDFIKTQNNSLHSLSLVKNDETILEKLKTFHPDTDYLKNLSYNTLGHLRCFKNTKDLKFEIDDFDACGEDSYRIMYMNSVGKWLHIPRCLYDWKLRNDSESHSAAKPNFNGNFDLAYNKIKNNCYYPYFDFNDVYEITCAISKLGINEISNKSIGIFSNNLTVDQKNKLRFLYSDCQLIFNENKKADFYIVIYNDYKYLASMKSLLLEMKNLNKDSKIILYYFEKCIFDKKDDLSNVVNQNINHIKEQISGFSYCYFLYFRHTYFEL